MSKNFFRLRKIRKRQRTGALHIGNNAQSPQAKGPAKIDHTSPDLKLFPLNVNLIVARRLFTLGSQTHEDERGAFLGADLRLGVEDVDVALFLDAEEEHRAGAILFVEGGHVEILA